MVLDGLEVPKPLACHAHHRLRHCRGEHEHAPLGVDRFEDRVDFIREPHVEHLVRLVEDEELNAGEIELASLDHVEHPSGRPDHDVSAALKGTQLQADGLATVDGDEAR